MVLQSLNDFSISLNKNFLKNSIPSMITPELSSSPSDMLGGQYIYPTYVDDIYETSSQMKSSPVEWQTSKSSDYEGEPVRKKQRLTANQTKSLENSFAMDSKLEPDKKHKLAVELGLHPKQVAIWYQNRRARTKTKTLGEKYDALQILYQQVVSENKKLQAEISNLKQQIKMEHMSTFGTSNLENIDIKRKVEQENDNQDNNVQRTQEGSMVTKNVGREDGNNIEKMRAELGEISCAIPTANLVPDTRDSANYSIFNPDAQSQYLAQIMQQEQEFSHANYHHIHYHNYLENQQQCQFSQQLQSGCNLNKNNYIGQFANDPRLMQSSDMKPVITSTHSSPSDDHSIYDYRFKLEDLTTQA